MVPDCIYSILEPLPDHDDIFRFKFSNSHPFLERMRVEIYHSQQPNEHIASTTRFFWGDGHDGGILDKIFRLRDAYDEDG